MQAMHDFRLDTGMMSCFSRAGLCCRGKVNHDHFSSLDPYAMRAFIVFITIASINTNCAPQESACQLLFMVLEYLNYTIYKARTILILLFYFDPPSSLCISSISSFLVMTPFFSRRLISASWVLSPFTDCFAGAGNSFTAISFACVSAGADFAGDTAGAAAGGAGFSFVTDGLFSDITSLARLLISSSDALGDTIFRLLPAPHPARIARIQTALK
jgi:hypothetical protein